MLQTMPKAEFNLLGDADGHLGPWHTAAQRNRGAFAPGFVPQAAVDKRLECGGTALNHQRTDAAAVEGHKEGINVGIGFEASGQFVLRHAAQDHAQGRRTRPEACRQARMVAQQRGVAHEDGIVEAAQMVNAQQRARCGERHGLRQEGIVIAPTSDKAIGRYGPFQRDKRTLLHLCRHEMAVER